MTYSALLKYLSPRALMNKQTLHVHGALAIIMILLIGKYYVKVDAAGNAEELYMPPTVG